MKPKSGFGEARSKQKASAQKKKKPKRGVTESPPWDDDEADEIVSKRKSELLEEIDTMFGDDDLTEKKVKSIFKNQFAALRKDFDASNLNLNSSATARAMTRATLAMLMDIIPIAEQTYRTSRKEQAAYSLNALVNQARELATDLKMMQDVDGQAEFIRDMLLNPVFMSLTQQIMSSMIAIKNTVDTQIAAKAPKRAREINKEVDSQLRALGEFLTMANTKTGTDVYRYLSGDPTLLSGTSSSGKKKRHK